MAANRIHRFSSSASGTASDKSTVAPVPTGFVVCPPQLATANGWQQEIYRLAYQRAQAAVQIPQHHRRLFSVWN